VFIERDQMLRGAPLPGWSGSFFHSAHMTFAIWEIADGAAPLHEHDHPQEEVWNVVSGEIALMVAGEERIVRAGCAVVVPPSTRHSARPLGACRALVTDWPLREELPGMRR
jgi:mannose-6-phosphate isomerase-like protein (cupin superfamily)